MSWLAGPHWFPAVVAFLIGAVLGRFLNRCIDRFPRHDALTEQLAALFRLSPAERHLQAARGFRHRLPVIGWLFRDHPAARSRRGEAYRSAGVELVNGLLFAALFWVEFPNGFIAGVPDPFAVEDLALLAPANGSLTLQIIRFVLHLVLVQALLVASVIDLDQMIIPDGSTLPATLFALLASFAAGGIWLVPAWYEDTAMTAVLGLGGDFTGGLSIPRILTDRPHLHGLLVSLAGLIVGGGTVWAVRLIGHWALGREAMGFGDVILMAMIGSVIGWQPVLVVFFLAPLCALVVVLSAVLTGSSREFPYGPWLSLATVALLIGWPAIWPHAGRFFLMGRLIPIIGLSVLVLLAVLLRGMRLLRGDDHWDGPVDPTWTSADQLLYQSQEHPEPAAASWKGRPDGEWPGVASGRGTLGDRRWRTGETAGWRVRPRS